MNLSEQCICNKSLKRAKGVKRLLPCRHLLDKACWEAIDFTDPEMPCPYCGELVEELVEVIRRKNIAHSLADRERIIRAANGGDCWLSLAETLGIPRATAEYWIKSGKLVPSKRGGSKPKILIPEYLEHLITCLEEDSQLTLKQMSGILHREFNVTASPTTISRGLDGMVYTVKKVHNMPANMNSQPNLIKRKAYVEKLQQYMEEGKHLVWMDETNFNLFCRRSYGRAKKGKRAVSVLPCSKGPNIHIIGAISSFGPELIEVRRGAFKGRDANEWVGRLGARIRERGVPLEDVVLICDNAPAHSQLEVAALEIGMTLLRLGPYSPMLNPIENVWSVVKSHVKRINRDPIVHAPGVGEQRLIYLENIIQGSIQEITPYLCSQTINHSTRFHRKALTMENMEVGV